MPAAVAGPEIERLIQLLARLPGLGPRSARRAALHLIKKRELLMAPLAAALETAMEKIEICKVCGNIDTQNPVHGLHRHQARCLDHRRRRRRCRSLGAGARPRGQRPLSRARRHAVAARRRRPAGPTIDSLVSRAHETPVKEVILALNATVDGQTTAHYITELVAGRRCEGDAAGAWRAGRRRTRLSRRGHARRGHQAAHAVLGSLPFEPLEMSAPLQPGQQQQARNAGQRADHEKPYPAGRIRQ